VIQHWGGFDETFRIAADYDVILRYFAKGGIRPAYVPRVLVKMRVGGESNRSLGRVFRKSREDYAALRRNRVGGLRTLVRKNFSKIGQFF
jgi:glycosyltransferase